MNEMDYATFRQQYEEQHPASVPIKPDATSDYPIWLEPLALVMFLAVSIVSGVHTVSTMRYTMIESMVIPEDAKNPAAAAAFFGFEIALFVSVFGWLRKDNRWLAYLATGVVFAVIVMANIQDVARAGADGLFNGIMVFGIGIGTPLVALFSGKLFVDIYRRKHVNETSADRQFTEAQRKWDATINRAYKQYMKEQEASTSVNLRKNTPLTEEPTPKMQEVIDWLRDNPEHLDTPSRQLVEDLRISHTTINKAQQWAKEHSTNGHH